MAQQIRWNNVDAPNFNSVASMQNQAMQMMQRGADSLLGIFENLNATDAANAQLQGQRSTEDALSQIMGLDIAGLKELQSSGGLNAETLRKKYGNQTDIMKILGFADGREGELQDRAVKSQKFDDMNAEVADRPNMSEFYKARAAGDVNGMIKAAENIQFYQNQANASGAIEDRRDKNFTQSMQKANLSIAQAGLAIRQQEFNLKAKAAEIALAKEKASKDAMSLLFGEHANSPTAVNTQERLLRAKADSNDAEVQKILTTLGLDDATQKIINEKLDIMLKTGETSKRMMDAQMSALSEPINAEKAQLNDQYMQQVDAQAPGTSIVLKAQPKMTLEDSIKDVKAAFDGRGIEIDEGSLRNIITGFKNKGGTNITYGEIAEAMKSNPGTNGAFTWTDRGKLQTDATDKIIDNIINLKTNHSAELNGYRADYRDWQTVLNNTSSQIIDSYRADMLTNDALGRSYSHGIGVPPSLRSANPLIDELLQPRAPTKANMVGTRVGSMIREFNKPAPQSPNKKKED